MEDLLHLFAVNDTEDDNNHSLLTLLNALSMVSSILSNPALDVVTHRGTAAAQGVFLVFNTFAVYAFTRQGGEHVLHTGWEFWGG
jgi:hypothetical protein